MSLKMHADVGTAMPEVTQSPHGASAVPAPAATQPTALQGIFSHEVSSFVTFGKC
jgi:hypothetical protein